MNLDEELKALAWVCHEMGMPAAGMVAQGIKETGWGKYMSAPFNCFGRKWKSAEEDGEGNYEDHVTKEYIEDKDPADDGVDGWTYLGDGWWEKSLKFKAYSSYEECVRDYCKRITTHPIYADAMEALPDFWAFIHAVAHHWATDPSYEEGLRELIEEEGLLELDSAQGYMVSL